MVCRIWVARRLVEHIQSGIIDWLIDWYSVTDILFSADLMVENDDLG
jgi:hypothetical protein